MARVYVSTVVNARNDRVWARVRDFNGLPQWHPGFSRSHIEAGLRGDTVGCIRNFDIADGGGTIRERLLTLSDPDYTMAYSILDAPLPVADYVATLKLYPITVGNKTLGTWSAEFRVTEGREADVVDRIANGTFGKAFEVIDKLLGQ